MAWTPSPATPVFAGSETLAVNVTVTYTPDAGAGAPTVTGYSAVWNDGPIPPQVSLAGGPAGVKLAAPNLIGMFPITVDYLLDGVPGQVTNWDDLPPDAEDIYLYAAPPVNTVERHFTATAHLSDTTSVSAQFTVRVTADYSSGRDRLVLEVDARR